MIPEAPRRHKAAGAQGPMDAIAAIPQDRRRGRNFIARYWLSWHFSRTSAAPRQHVIRSAACLRIAWRARLRGV